jgi:copper chaperone CopZ
MKIQLLHFPDCPNADVARAALREAMLREQVGADIEEIDTSRQDSPAWAKGWGSPTILVDGRDIGGEHPVQGEASCRLYKDGAPTVDEIRRSIRGASAKPASCGDLVRGRFAWLLWGLPGVAFVAGAVLGDARTSLWIPALVIAGSACLFNAARCRRLHCFLTGPLFLLGAFATALDAAGHEVVAWPWIFGAMVVGTVAAFGVEAVRGTYAGGSTRTSSIPIVGAVLAALAASACCLVPAVLAIVGVSGAGASSALAPYRPLFLAITGIAIAAGFWFAYRPVPADACGCGPSVSRRRTRIALWLSTLLAIAFAAYPLVIDANASSHARARGPNEIRLHVTGMDCGSCTKVLTKRLSRIPEVATVDVDYDRELAVVTYDGKRDISQALIEAVDDVGYQATVVR